MVENEASWPAREEADACHAAPNGSEHLRPVAQKGGAGKQVEEKKAPPFNPHLPRKRQPSKEPRRSGTIP
jgi:hypothetical protein